MHFITNSLPGCELPANIVFVMDESGSIGYNNYIKEKAFVKLVLFILYKKEEGNNLHK